MKNPNHHVPFWESSTRSLTVPSVWVETPVGGGRLQRHFLLDFQRKGQSGTKESDETLLRKQRQNFQYSYSCGCLNLENVNARIPAKETLALALSRVQLHEPPTQPQPIKRKLIKFIKRSSIGGDSCDTNIQTQQCRNFLQSQSTEIMSASNQPDGEVYADRVLTWLDLAGRKELVKTEPDTEHNSKHKQMEILKTQRGNGRQRSHRSLLRAQTAHSKHTTPSINLSSKNSRASSTTALLGSSLGVCEANYSTESTSSNQSKQCGNIKQITIIFDKDGNPVRLDRPLRALELRNIDSKTSLLLNRQLGNNLVMQRSYQDYEAIRSCQSMQQSQFSSKLGKFQTQVSIPSRRQKPRPHGDASETTDSSTTCLATSTINNCKKQLHIFMPVLAKQTL